MEEIQDAIKNGSVLVIIVASPGGGKSTYAKKLLEPFKYKRRSQLSSWNYVYSSIMGVYVKILVNDWEIDDEEVMLYELYDVNHQEMQNMSKLPRFFREDIVSERRIYNRPTKANPASLVITMYPEEYAKCQTLSPLKEHYLIGVEKDFSTVIKKVESPSQRVTVPDPEPKEDGEEDDEEYGEEYDEVIWEIK